MREQFHDYNEAGPKFTCCRWVLAFGPRGAHWVRLPCGGWTCEYCREVHIEDWAACVSQEISGPHVFVKELNMEGKDVSAYVRQNVKGPYFVVHRPDGSAVLITRFKLEGSIRRAKAQYLEREFADMLREPWPKGKQRKGISTRHGVYTGRINSRNYCFVFGAGGDDNDEFKKLYKRIAKEFKSLNTDVDRGKFLYDLTLKLGSDLRLFEPGQKLIDAYHAAVECEERQAIMEEGGYASW